MDMQEYEKMEQLNKIHEKAKKILTNIKTQENEIRRYERYKNDVFEIVVSPSNNERNKVKYANLYFTGESKNKIIDIVIEDHKKALERNKEQFESIKYEVIK